MKTSIFFDRNIDNHRTLNFVRNTTTVIIDLADFSDMLESIDDGYIRQPVLYSYDSTPKQLYSGIVAIDKDYEGAILSFMRNELTGKPVRKNGADGAIKWVHNYLCKDYLEFARIVIAALKGDPLPIEVEEKPFVLQEGYNANSPVINKYEKQGTAVRQARKKTKKDNRVFSVHDIEQDTRTIVVPKDTETPAQEHTEKPKSIFEKKSKKTFIFDTRLRTRNYIKWSDLKARNFNIE